MGCLILFKSIVKAVPSVVHATFVLLFNEAVNCKSESSQLVLPEFNEGRDLVGVVSSTLTVLAPWWNILLPVAICESKVTTVVLLLP